jgi:RNA polymerase sigma-70 factor (ECF subfamily)
MFRLAKKMLPQHDGIQDILQDVFTELYRCLNSGYIIENPQSWLYRVTCNKCIDSFRKQKRLLYLPDDIAEMEQNHQELREEMTIALSALSAKERLLAILYSEGHSYKEISTITGIKFSSVGKLLSRTLKKIEHELKTIGYKMPG